jgi:hypothetical protein
MHPLHSQTASRTPLCLAQPGMDRQVHDADDAPAMSDPGSPHAAQRRPSDQEDQQVTAFLVALDRAFRSFEQDEELTTRS